jgi:uncharacterized membrane protein
MRFKMFNKKIISLFFSVAILSVFIAIPALAADPLGPVADAVKGTGIDKNPKLALFIGNLVRFILGFLGLLLVVIIVYAGYIWTTAQGDTKKVDKAKDMIKNAVIGLAIVFAAYAIEAFVVSGLSDAAIGR